MSLDIYLYRMKPLSHEQATSLREYANENINKLIHIYPDLLFISNIESLVDDAVYNIATPITAMPDGDDEPARYLVVQGDNIIPTRGDHVDAVRDTVMAGRGIRNCAFYEISDQEYSVIRDEILERSPDANMPTLEDLDPDEILVYHEWW